ncbi:MAG: hypothetical protein NZ853_08200 [Leptospiraceae bacterium]|nr:hypothetical protein [Leptospiraceae bacterium]MDW7976844.1 hypothetical protein [Leptospiraceae bacterium]
MILSKSCKVLFEPIEFEGKQIKKAKLIISDFQDEPGVLYKISVVLYVYGWSILSAKIQNKNDFIEDVITIEPTSSITSDQIKPSMIEAMEKDLESLLNRQITIGDYLSKYPEKTQKLMESLVPNPSTEIEIEVLDKGNTVLKVSIKTPDRVGIIYSITQIFYLSDLNILDFDVETENHIAKDVFLIQKMNKGSFTSRNIEELRSLLKKFI